MIPTAPGSPLETMPPIGFMDVGFLLEASQPRQRTGWFWYAMGGFLLVVLASTYASMHSSKATNLINQLSGLVMFGVIAGMSMVTWAAVRRARVEQMRIESIEELVQLRRWPLAAIILNGMLSQPTRSAHGRVQALIYLTAVLARYGRFADAIAVQEHLLDHVEMDPGTDYGLRLGRAMALLHEERLFDADRAINELRRTCPDQSSAGLALVEIYRDVKTGHPAEAIELFNAKLSVLRAQLGHRTADAWGLAARAYDLLDRHDEAGAAYANATLLAPAAELHRRYAEVATLSGKYPCSEAPVEMR
jgi:tetratricopeptide (TPR) repeat protein